MPQQDRRRTTRLGVRVADKTARVLITVGGVGTIAAVCAVAVFLVWVAAPLFFPSTLAVAGHASRPLSPDDLIHLEVDEDRQLALCVTRDALARVVEIQTGETISEVSLCPKAPTSFSNFGNRGSIALGFADGRIQVGSLRFRDEFVEEEGHPELSALLVGERRRYRDGVMLRVRSGELRWTRIEIELDPPLATNESAPIERIDHVVTPSAVVALTQTSNGLSVHRISTRRSLLDGSISIPPLSVRIAGPESLPPNLAFVRLAGQGGQAYAIDRSGEIRRFDLSTLREPRLAETIPAQADYEEVVACQWAKGRETLLVAMSTGRIEGGFLVRSGDTQRFRFVHQYRSDGVRPSALAASHSERLFGVLTVDGRLAVHQVTTAEELCSTRMDGPIDSAVLAFAPRADGLLALTSNQLVLVDLDRRYPEATASALFLPVWYEGYDAPAHVWQSASDEEPKFGLIPLVFGTIKATVYAMLFGVPLALLAATYTSEFLRPRTKARIKPTIELMASLPSVVLGFIGAFVLAPFVAGHVCALLCTFVTVPWTFLLAGHLWQTLPNRIRLPLVPYRFWLMLAVLPLGILMGQAVAPIVERVFFADDIFLWLSGARGAGAIGWMFFLLPLSGVLTGWFFAKIVDPPLRGRSAHLSRFGASIVALVRFLAGTAVAFTLAWSVAVALDGMGWDPRGYVLGPYDQRNALIVGFVMGFAIIPIIFTISEDALATVPEHLRSASLGAGATQWQTATRIVIPAAASGLFSAVMVGLGRAVGETMIVLMAAGGTPILDWNPFNGFKTLSVNIANELPEAAVGSAHYRILFLSALVLFVLTSVLNTVAEIVRVRFRRRAVQL